MGWDIDSLKEHYDRVLEEKDRALAAALIAVKEENRKTEIAAEKRFELLNELRGGVATKEQFVALGKVVDDLKASRDAGQGRGAGLSQGWTLLISGVSLIGGVIAIFYALTR